MREMLAVALAGTTAYVGDPEPTARRDWRRFLDLMEEIGGSEKAEDILRRHVLVPSQIEQLDARTAARAEYADLQERGGTWSPPWMVRRSMGTWDFDAAQPMIETSNEILEQRDRLVTTLAAVDLDIPGELEEAYETEETRLERVQDRLGEYEDAANALVATDEAVNADHGLIRQLGLLGDDGTDDLASARAAYLDGDLDAAATSLERADEVIDDGQGRGTTRLLIAGGAVVGLLLLALAVRSAVRRRRRRRAAAASPDDDQPDRVLVPSLSGPGAAEITTDPIRVEPERIARDVSPPPLHRDLDDPA
jgi:hypothetical protein